jgi:hypothetical protein
MVVTLTYSNITNMYTVASDSWSDPQLVTEYEDLALATFVKLTGQ